MPFPWNRLPGFNEHSSFTPFSQAVSDGSRPPPAPAYCWTESIGFYMNRALTSPEAVPMVDLIKEYGRFCGAARVTAIATIRHLLNGSIFQLPRVNVNQLYASGAVVPEGKKSSSSDKLFQVPVEYSAFIPPVLWPRKGVDEPLLGIPAVMDREGICCIVVSNHREKESKYRQSEMDGMQSLVNAIWKEGRTDIFDVPVFCYVDYLCFRVIAAPAQMWLRDEEPLVRFEYSTRYDGLFADLQNHMMKGGPGLKDIVLGGNTDTPPFLVSHRRQKIIPYALSDIPGEYYRCGPPSLTIDAVVAAMNDFESLVVSPVVFRSVLRENGFPVRFIGRLLDRLSLPCLKQTVVNEMISRRAKWHFRRIQFSDFVEGRSIGRLDWTDLIKSSDFCDGMLKSASEYFQVPLEEILPFFVNIHLFGCRMTIRTPNSDMVLFPHAPLIRPAISPREPDTFVPRTKCIYPRPPLIKIETRNRNPLDYLPLQYAAQVFGLEMSIAIGDLVQASVTLGQLVGVILRMEEIEPVDENKQLLRERALALSLKSRDFTPVSVTPPMSALRAIVQITKSMDVYSAIRSEVLETEGPDTITLLSLDCAMAKAVPAHLAVATLVGCCSRAEQNLGARHPVTVTCWVQLGQAVKKHIESQEGVTEQLRLALLREGITCLNKAKVAVQISDPEISITGALDHGSMIHYLLSILYLWNGEPGKALAVSREGLVGLETKYSIYHPRYLNSAFLHAKLLELHAASVRDPAAATACAREAINVLEDVLGALLDLTDDKGSLRQELFSFDDFLGGPEQFEPEVDAKRKLSVVALIIKMNVWLLDEVTSRDILDLIVCTELEGSPGVAELPARMVVKQHVVSTVEQKLKDFETNNHSFSHLPILELTDTLPEPVISGCNLALDAKTHGKRVSSWFHQFLQVTCMSFGDSRVNQYQEILKSIFLTFIFIENVNTVWAGPLSSPLVKRAKHNEELAQSKSTIYRDWEQSATLYCIDHDLYGG